MMASTPDLASQATPERSARIPASRSRWAATSFPAAWTRRAIGPIRARGTCGRGRKARPQGRGPACQPGLGEISNMDDTRAMDPDDRRPADEPAADEPTADEPAADEPAAWDRHEMETDDAGELQERDVEPLNPKWNKGQM